jgi:4-aminobutyrate aminotransferase-like enzyme
VEAPGVSTVGAGEPPILWQEARGANVVDVDGNRYLDLTAGFGVAAAGHRHPAVVAAVRRQSARLLHGLGDVHAHPLRLALAEELARRVPVDDAQVYFAISGADAVEVALKTAWLATGRRGVVAFDPSFHGVTLGALAASSRPRFRRPFAAHLSPRLHRLSFGAAPAELAALLAGGDIAAVIAEPMVGREGVLLPPSGWLAEIAAAARRHGTLLIADEIFTGFGRTGRWFAVDHEGVRPDLLCCGKALTGGMPLAAAVGRRELMAAWDGGGEALHTTTFLAHPPACAAALAQLEVLAGQRLPERAARLGAELGERLGAWPCRFAAVTAVRGRGLLWGLELTSSEAAHSLAALALGRGLLLLAGGAAGDVVQLVPPLTITRRQLDAALTILEEVLPQVASLR